MTGLRSSMMLAADGLQQWRDVFSAVERHMEGQQEILIGVGVALLVLLVFGVDVWLARRLIRKREGRSKES